MTVQFVELAMLLGHDQDRVRLVVREFYYSATKDLLLLECAAAAHEWQTVRELAKRIHVSCLQICESRAADAASALGNIPGEFFAGIYAMRRVDIVDLLDRAKEFSDVSVPIHRVVLDRVERAGS